jgi:hypothetical protein
VTEAAGSHAEASSREIRIAVLSDSQMMTLRAPERYLTAVGWLADHWADLGLDLVVHVGDVVNNGADDPAQFQLAARAHQELLDAGVPLLVAAGNHDYDDMLAATRRSTTFNQHVGYHALHRQPGFHSLEPGAAENSYLLVNDRLLVMALEFGPRPAVVDWAAGVLAEHADRTAILVTHSYLDGDGELTGDRSRFHPRSFPAAADGLDGEQLWDRLIRRHAGVAAVLCGHQIPRPVAYRLDAGDAGRPVLQSFQNWQCAPDDLMGCLRLITVRPDEVLLDVVDTATGELLDGAANPGYHARIDLARPGARYPAQGDDLDRWPADR